ncbi:hypothetical protein MKW98_026829 [Papaver atlanticum]|uniref:Uncharacterized protein n=1 Tax=Papaver atlanticum TaxID=357466 RepID=A0AAD4S036_9MAGN|nr:hypothetical protein MKW98_026829 [Papaver atlanticum]
MKTKRETGCFDRASPALKEILLKFYYSHEKQSVTDYQLNEFGSVQYHIQVFSQDFHHIYLSVSSPLLRNIFITRTFKIISSLHADIVCSQLKKTKKFWNNYKNTSQGMYIKPIKVVLDAKDHFFVITQPEKTAAVFPMRFGDDSDVIIATTLFQELVVLGSSKSCAKAPPCTYQFLLRNCEENVLSRHIKRSRIDKTVWNLSNFQAKFCITGFVQRSMRKRVESLSEMLLNPVLAKQHETSSMKNQGHRRMKIFRRLPKAKILRKQCSGFLKKIMQLRSKIKIHGLNQIRRRWLKLSQCYSSRSYTRLD